MKNSQKREQKVKTTMSGKPIRRDRASIPCSYHTKEIARSLKRSQQTYDDLLRRMVEQYDPDAGHDQEGGK